MAEKFKLRKGDKVVVLTGKDKGKEGEILSVLREERRAGHYCGCHRATKGRRAAGVGGRVVRKKRARR